MDIWLEKLNAAKRWYFQHERKLLPLALLGGFLFDWFTVTRVDQLYGNILLIVYMLMAAVTILFIHLHDAGRITVPTGSVLWERLVGWGRLAAPLVLQFTFGGLFSVFLVFYARAGSFAVSWLFILILVGLMIGNDFFREHYELLNVQISILLLSVFLFSIFFLPILLLEIGTQVFILAGIVSLTLILLYFNLLDTLIPNLAESQRRNTLAAIVAVYATINILYFAGVIPPLPLSMHTGEVVHSVARSNDSQYIVQDEQESFTDSLTENWLWFIPDEIHILPGEPVYFFSSVFAPTDLTFTVTHDWQHYDPTEKRWVSSSRISFPVRGGRDNGYRGFSVKRNIFPGLWRVDVETAAGRVIGRSTFRVKRVSAPHERPVIRPEVR